MVEQKSGLIVLQEFQDVTEEESLAAEKSSLRSMLEKSKLFEKLGVTAEQFVGRFHVLVDGAKSSLDVEVTPFQKVVVLPVLIGG